MQHKKTDCNDSAAPALFLLMLFACYPASGAATQGELLVRDPNITTLVVIYYAPTPKTPPEAKAAELLKSKYKLFVRRDQRKPQEKTPSVHVDFVDVKEAGLEAPSMELLKYFGRGISAEQVSRLQKSTKALALSFVYRQSDVLSAVGEMSKLAADIAATTDGMVWDEATRELFSADAWQKTHVDQWSDGFPMVTKHTTVHAYNSGELVRAVTLGMSKFGLPDLVINDFSWADSAPIGSAINGLQQLLVEGAPATIAGPFDIDIRAIKHSVYRKHLLDSRIENGTGAGKMTLGAAKLEEGDPDNRLIEITFDRYDGKSPQERQNQFVSEIFGHNDDVIMTKHSAEIVAVSLRAKKKFESFRPRFAKGLEPGERLLVKSPFKTKSGGNEWMWVEVIKWQGEEITGLLRNDPEFIPNLRAGATVHVKQDEMFDYLHYSSDGKAEGNETGPMLERNAK